MLVVVMVVVKERQQPPPCHIALTVGYIRPDQQSHDEQDDDDIDDNDRGGSTATAGVVMVMVRTTAVHWKKTRCLRCVWCSIQNRRDKGGGVVWKRDEISRLVLV